MKKIAIIGLVLFFSGNIYGQTQFIAKAKIEFEKRVNVWAFFTGDFGMQMRKATPQYTTSYFNYEFDQNKSIYQPGRPVDRDNSRDFYSGSPASDNVVYSDYSQGIFTATKNVFEKTFLIEDSLRKTNWKITNDFREIAGFNCRRATTVIMDSVFVVAFYTDEIMIPGGPESFNGLPGMIMGLVINRLHTTWYATKVEINSVNEKNIIPPITGKKTTVTELMDYLKKALSSWGTSGVRNIWGVMI